MESTPHPPPPKPPSALLGFAERYRTASGKLRLRFRWRRILLVMVLLFCLGWMGKSVALHAVYKYHHEFEEVGFTDMLLFPFNRTEVRQKFGDYQIEKAKEALEVEDYAAANRLARLGLIRNPRNIEGRQIVAEFTGLRRPDQAVQILEEGLPYAGDDVTYLNRYLQLLFHLNEDDRIRNLAETKLPEIPELTHYNRALALAAARAHYFRGAYDPAERLLAKYQLDNSLEGIALLSQIDWNRGHREVAVRRMERYAAQAREPQLDVARALIARFHRELGNLSQARRHTLLRTANNPFAPQPRIDLLYLSQLQGNEEAVRREAMSILRAFAEDSEAVAALSSFAAENGNLPLARLLYERAVENRFDLARFGLLYIETHLEAGAYADAIAFCNDLLQENPAWLQHHEAEFNRLRSLGYFGIGNTELGSLYLNRFLQIRNLRTPTLLAASQDFRKRGLNQQARRILATAYDLDPRNQAALAAIVEIDLEKGNTRDLARNLRELLLLRRPSYDLMRRAYEEIGSDRFLFLPNRDTLLIHLGAVLDEVAVRSPSPRE